MAQARRIQARHLRLGRGRRSLIFIPPLDDLSCLESLDVSRAQIHDLSELAKLPGLVTLDISDTLVDDLAFLEFVPNLKVLNISNTRVSDLSPLHKHRHLRVLEMRETRIRSLAPLANCLELSSLNASESRVEDLTPLSGLRLMEKLRLNNTLVSSLHPLQTMTKLTALYLMGTNVSDISPLSEAKSLRVLWLDNCPVSDLSPLQDLNNLNRLDITGTKVADLSPLSKLRKLASLMIDDSPVRDLSPLVDMEAMYVDSGLLGGLSFGFCPLDDPYLREKSESGGHRSYTQEVIDYLRRQRGLPPFRDPTETASVGKMLSELPAQGAGVHFEFSEEGMIDFAAPANIDADGNNIARLQSLKPLLVDVVKILDDSINPNQHPQLKDLIETYYDLIDRDLQEIPFAQLFGVGLRLENAANAANRKISDRELPELEDHAKEALDSVMALHGPFILASKEGAELVEAASKYERRREDEVELREAAVRLANDLRSAGDLISEDAASFVKDSAESISEGRHPERSTVFGLGTTKNAALVLIAGASFCALPVVGGAAIGASGAVMGTLAALVGIEGLKKSTAFNSLSGIVKDGIDELSDAEIAKVLEEKAASFAPHLRFVLEHEHTLRAIAGSRKQFGWLHKYLDWLKVAAASKQ